jgi:SRSO17 transposase
MEADEIEALGPTLDAYLAEFDDCFGRVEPRAHLRTYVRGQLSGLPRKSVEPIAVAAGVPPRTLQDFLSAGKWRHGMMRDRLQQVVARDHAGPLAVGLIDETSQPKKGEHTPGAKRQHCGATGKIDNCVVTVHLGYAAPGGFHCLLDGELFLPEDWSADRARCRAAGIPDDVVHRPKWRIALELLDRARANGVVLPWLTFDEGYGRATEFLHALDDRGQQYVAEVPTTFTGWTTRPPLLHREHHPEDRLGRPRTFPRLAASARPASAVRDLLRCSSALNQQPWERFHVKDTTKGPAVWEARMVPFFLKRDGLPTTRPHWLVVARNVREPDEVKFFVSNAPAGTPAEVVLHVAFNRWPVERCFEDTKTELGLDHFEGRTYDALIRHLAITAVTFLFLSKVRLDRGGKKSGPDRVPGADGRRRAGRLGGPVPAVPPGIARAGGRVDRPHPGPEPAGRRLPPTCHARAA